jgi:hypothetical protein
MTRANSAIWAGRKSFICVGFVVGVMDGGRGGLEREGNEDDEASNDIDQRLLEKIEVDSNCPSPYRQGKAVQPRWRQIAAAHN